MIRSGHINKGLNFGVKFEKGYFHLGYEDLRTTCLKKYLWIGKKLTQRKTTSELDETIKAKVEF